MADLQLEMTYEFQYSVNPPSITDLRKKALRGKSCQQNYLERLFNNLPSFFDKNIDGTRNYFKDEFPADPADPLNVANAGKPNYLTKAVMSCVAAHFCDRMFPMEGEPMDPAVFPPDLARTAAIFLEANADEPSQNYGMESNLAQALRQLNLGTATGFWLDYWGSFFLSTGRFVGDTDDSMRYKIANSLNQPRNTIQVLTDAIRQYFGDSFSIYELEWTGIHEPDDSPKIGGVVPPPEPGFEHGSVKDIGRRRARLVIEIVPPDPPAGGMFVSDDSPAGASLLPDEWFIRQPSDAPPLADGDPRTRSESYVADPFSISKYGITMPALKSLVDSLKPGGVRVYYKVGGQYVIV